MPLLVVEELERSSASRAYGTLLMITAWYTSARWIWAYASTFLHDKTIKVERCSTKQTGFFQCRNEDVAAILGIITPKEQPSSLEAISAIQRTAHAATVHAEAALMGYAYHGVTKKTFSTVCDYITNLNCY